jgi:hypothetical protein
MRGFALCLAAALWTCTVGPAPAAAQEVTAGAVVDPTAAPEPGIDPTLDAGSGSGLSKGTGATPLVAPVPFKNTQLGWGLLLLAGLIHHFDADSTIKPSTGAVGGFYSENGSWGLMALEMARLARDRWRLRGVAAYTELRYDFYGVGEDAGNEGRSIPLEQTVSFALASAVRRVAPGWYVGPTLVWMQSTVGLRDSLEGTAPPEEADLVETNLVAPGILIEADTRDDDYWPTRGAQALLQGRFFLDDLGGERSFQRYVAFLSWYARLKDERLVLALNANGCATGGDVPFYALASVGAGRGALRGYTQGRYRDTVMTTVQTELRFHTSGRWGAVAFAGFGKVAPSVDEIFDSEFLPAGGVGARFKLTRNYPMHLRFDIAWGKNGALTYFGVAEAF